MHQRSHYNGASYYTPGAFFSHHSQREAWWLLLERKRRLYSLSPFRFWKDREESIIMTSSPSFDAFLVTVHWRPSWKVCSDRMRPGKQYFTLQNPEEGVETVPRWTFAVWRHFFIVYYFLNLPALHTYVVEFGVSCLRARSGRTNLKARFLCCAQPRAVEASCPPTPYVWRSDAHLLRSLRRVFVAWTLWMNPSWF